jgi:hypothetical protein
MFADAVATAVASEGADMDVPVLTTRPAVSTARIDRHCIVGIALSSQKGNVVLALIERCQTFGSLKSEGISYSGRTRVNAIVPLTPKSVQER